MACGPCEKAKQNALKLREQVKNGGTKTKKSLALQELMSSSGSLYFQGQKVECSCGKTIDELYLELYAIIDSEEEPEVLVEEEPEVLVEEEPEVLVEEEPEVLVEEEPEVLPEEVVEVAPKEATSRTKKETILQDSL